MHKWMMPIFGATAAALLVTGCGGAEEATPPADSSSSLPKSAAPVAPAGVKTAVLMAKGMT